MTKELTDSSSKELRERVRETLLDLANLSNRAHELADEAQNEVVVLILEEKRKAVKKELEDLSTWRFRKLEYEHDYSGIDVVNKLDRHINRRIKTLALEGETYNE